MESLCTNDKLVEDFLIGEENTSDSRGRFVDHTMSCTAFDSRTDSTDPVEETGWCKSLNQLGEESP